MIQVKCPGQNLIGDALCAVPFILYLCQKHAAGAFITDGFNVPVRDLIPSYPFEYREPTCAVEAVYELDIQAAWQMNFHKRWPWHMAQMYFAYAGEPIPSLPMNYQMHAASCGLSPGIVLSPFSRTNAPDNNKLWPHERWAEVIGTFKLTPAYVIGTDEDNFSAYEGLPNVIILRNRPLPEILTLLRQAHIVLSLDNGIGHLCHFGKVRRHVMLYADCLPPTLAENPFAVHVRGRMPIDIPVANVIDDINYVLQRESASVSIW